MLLVHEERNLSVHHPDYRYPSSKNPYASKLLAAKEKVFTNNETELHLGHWRQQFTGSHDESELHVEIGCNAGHVIVESANQNLNRLYIGIDWKFKPIFRGVEKAEKKNLKNLIFFRAHAERLHFMFKPEEIDRLNLYFPDPWAKKSQLKNRFVNPDRLRKILPLLKPNGIFHIKTDHADYFKWICQSVQECAESWKILEISHDLHKNNPAPQLLNFPEVTLFEKLFIKDKLPIHSLTLQKL